MGKRIVESQLLQLMAKRKTEHWNLNGLVLNESDAYMRQ